MRYKCRHCGRTFVEKCFHTCNGTLRKRHLEWQIVDLTAAEYIRFKTINAILCADIIPTFGSRLTLQEAKDEIDKMLSNAEREQQRLAVGD